MILAVDIGNSNIVVGGMEGQKIIFEARVRTDATKTSDEYCIDLKNILDIYGVERTAVEGAIIASVVPQVLNSIKTAIKKLTGKNLTDAVFDSVDYHSVKLGELQLHKVDEQKCKHAKEKHRSILKVITVDVFSENQFIYLLFSILQKIKQT